MSKSKFAIGALIGAAAGIIAGILTAPKSGKETRADIKEKAVDLKDEAVKRASTTKDRVEDAFDDAKEKAVKGSLDSTVSGARNDPNED